MLFDSSVAEQDEAYSCRDRTHYDKGDDEYQHYLCAHGYLSYADMPHIFLFFIGHLLLHPAAELEHELDFRRYHRKYYKHNPDSDRFVENIHNNIAEKLCGCGIGYASLHEYRAERLTVEVNVVEQPREQGSYTAAYKCKNENVEDKPEGLFNCNAAFMGKIRRGYGYENGNESVVDRIRICGAVYDVGHKTDEYSRKVSAENRCEESTHIIEIKRKSER